jgi:hypothetical protein
MNRARCACWRLLCVALCLPGCVTPPPTQPDTDGPPRQLTDEQHQRARELIAAHNARVAQLQQVYTAGVIEVRWTDDRGRHFEQGDASIWLDLPHRTALRIDKLDEVLFWLGSDADRYWLFDLLADESTLSIGRTGRWNDQAQGPFAVDPRALLNLLALMPLPDSATLVGADADSLTLQVPTARGRISYRFDLDTGLPTAIRVDEDTDRRLAASTLRRPGRAEQPDSLSINWPFMPMLIDVELFDEVDAVTGQLKIALEFATTDMETQPIDRVFDLDRLTQAFQPQHVFDVDQPAPVEDE